MSHKEQHDQKHKKQHEEKIKKQHERDVEWEKTPRKMHPVWFVAIGVVLIGMVVATWTFFFL